MALERANLDLPLAASYNTRGVAGFANTVTAAKDQRKINAIYELIQNSVTGQPTLYLTKRPGVTDVGSDYGTTGQVAYLWEVGAGATTNAAANRWVFSTSSNDIRASNTSTTTIIATAAGYAPAFVDKTAISGTDTVVVQLRNSSGTQTAWHSTAIATFTQISDTTFTNLAHQGKIEHRNGWSFVSTRNRIYNSDLNSLSSWSDTGYIDRLATQDIGTGLAKLGPQIISFGTATMEVYQLSSVPSGSPLEAVHGAAQRFGLPSTIVTGMRHYYAELGGRIYWRGSNPSGVFAYDGTKVEKVSSVAVDKILTERQVYNVSPVMIQGQQAVAFCLDLPDAATQRSLLFFPEWNDWFEWSSTVFIPQASPRLSDVFLGVGSNQHKLYALATTADTFQDAGGNYQWLTQFKIPPSGGRRNRMHWCELVGDTAGSTLNIDVQFSDDDYATFNTARAVDMAGTAAPRLTRCGAYSRGRAVKLSYTGSLQPRIERFKARID